MWKITYFSVNKYNNICLIRFLKILHDAFVPDINFITELMNQLVFHTEIFRYVCLLFHKLQGKIPNNFVQDLENYFPIDDLLQTFKKLSIGCKNMSTVRKHKMLKSTNTTIKGNTIIFIVGGTTYNEIFKLRQIYPKSLILTTNIWNTNTLYEAITQFK